MRLIAQFLIGLLFGSGLIVAGMSNPAKVLNFLDVWGISGGRWDGSLALVMAGAILVGLFGYRQLARWPHPLLAEGFASPRTTGIDRRIIVGPAIFGIGWGLAGFCPGPALTAIIFGSDPAWIFTAAMLAGMAAAQRCMG